MNANVTPCEPLRTALPPADVPSYDAGGMPPRLACATNWALMTKRLLGFATERLSRHGSNVFRYVNRAEDFVQEAVTLYMDGTRRSAAKDEEELFWFVCGVVSSLISHEAEKARRRGIHTSITVDDPEGGEMVEIQIPSGENFEIDIMAKDDLEHFMASLEPDLEQYVRLRAEDAGDTAEDYAAALGTTVAKVRNMDRRLRRRRDQWLTQ